MGMAASQARYLALVARKSNCEYEGQQINQARTVLSNQSANLFNQMLGLSVPVPPSTQDYTKQQYSYSDGVNEYVIDNWEQLASPEEEYNYVVTRYKYSDVYTGSQKKLSDPQVQFSSGQNASVDQIEKALMLVTQTKKEYEEAKAATKAKQDEAALLSNSANIDTYTGISSCNYNADDNTYTVSQNETVTIDGQTYRVYINSDDGSQYYLKDGKYYSNDAAGTEYTGDVTKLTAKQKTTVFNGYSEANKDQIEAAVNKLIEEGALSSDYKTDYASFYIDDNGNIALKSDLRNLYGGTTNGTKTVLPVYPTQGDKSVESIAAQYDTQIAALQAMEFQALQAYQAAEQSYESLSRPTYIGNCELTLLTELTDDQKAELSQIVKDMKDQGVDASILDCFNEYGEYSGGIYQFKLNGVTYYTTFADLNKSYASGDGINNIDGQTQLSYYNASYVKTKQEETKAKGEGLFCPFYKP